MNEGVHLVGQVAYLPRQVGVGLEQLIELLARTGGVL